MTAFPRPPTKHELEKTGVPDDYLLDDRRLPGGPMARHLGPQISLEQVRSANDYIDDERVQRFVRAYTVPGLSGMELEADCDTAIVSALVRSLKRQLPAIEWHVESDLTGPLRKYGLLHTSVPAPPDETTGQPMALEICGRLLFAGDAYDWRKNDLFDVRRALLDPEQSIPLPGPVTIRLDRAVYANVLYPGIGMPLYM